MFVCLSCSDNEIYLVFRRGFKQFGCQIFNLSIKRGRGNAWLGEEGTNGIPLCSFLFQTDIYCIMPILVCIIFICFIVLLPVNDINALLAQ